MSYAKPLGPFYQESDRLFFNGNDIKSCNIASVLLQAVNLRSSNILDSLNTRASTGLSNGETAEVGRTVDKTILNLELESAVDWSMLESIVNGSPISEEDTRSSVERKKFLMVVGVNTVFSCRKRRGENRKKLDEEKGIIIRFVISQRSDHECCSELLAQEKAQTSSSFNEEVDLDELMDDPELEKLHADRIAALKREAEKRQSLTKKGHGEYREISEGDFLGEVTGSEKVVFANVVLRRAGDNFRALFTEEGIGSTIGKPLHYKCVE
ncbi:thioredoxin domain-containing protein PLP3A [Tanacetum coccineum]